MRAAVGDGHRIGRKRRLAVCLAGLVLAAGCGSAPAGSGGPSAQTVPGRQAGGPGGSGGSSGSATAPGGQPGQGQGHGQSQGQGGSTGGSVRKQVGRSSGGFEVTVAGPILGAPGFFFSEPVKFGPQRLGTPSASKTFRVMLATSYPARIDRIGPANAGVEADVGQFPVSADECTGVTLGPHGAACTAAVRFVPGTSGTHSAYLVASVTILCEDRDQFPCAPPDPNLPPANFPHQDVSPSGQVTVPHSEPLALLQGEGVDPAQATTTTGSETTTSGGSPETSASTGSTGAPPGSGTAPQPPAPTSTL